MDQKNKPGLFPEFSPVSTEAWEKKIVEDLKGADYEKRLVWQTVDGLSVRPYFREEDLKKLPYMGILPGQAPYIRGKKVRCNDWIIRQDFCEANVKNANELARYAIEKGVGAVGLNASEVTAEAEMKSLLEGIDLDKTGIHLQHGKNYPALFDLLVNVDPSASAKGSLNFDPLAYFLLYARFYNSQESDMQEAKRLLMAAKKQLPGFLVLSINGQHYHNAGAGIVQELAFALAQANEYLAELTELGLSVDDIAPRMQFTFAVGSDYFLEIAKLRTVKALWSHIVQQYHPQDEASGKMNLHAVTSSWNKSVYDPYVNMLRTTTEAMAASIGGVDSISVHPFDTTFKKPDQFSYRMARNQQIILKQEAYFDKVADPAAGSYYVESLCDSIGAAAWELFVEIEEKGGFVKAVSDGFIKEAIENVCQKRDMEIAMRKKVFVGTNKYPDTDEKVLKKIRPTAQLTDLSGLRQYRGTQAFEALRLAVENHAEKGNPVPKVFMLTYGNPAMRKARATFSANFFGVAGYLIVDNLGFPDVETGARAAIDSDAEIVVFCSSDETYGEMANAATIIKKESPKTQVVVAGNPKEHLDLLNRSGVDDYVHVRTNVLEALTRYNSLLGIA